MKVEEIQNNSIINETQIKITNEVYAVDYSQYSGSSIYYNPEFVREYVRNTSQFAITSASLFGYRGNIAIIFEYEMAQKDVGSRRITVGADTK